MMTGGVVFWGLNFEGVISGALLYIRDDFDSVDKETVLQVLTTNRRLHFFFFFLFDLTTPISSLTFHLVPPAFGFTPTLFFGG